MNKKQPVPVITGDTNHNWVQNGKLLEQSGHHAKAIFLYEALLKKQPNNPYIYDRLMIIYRRQKAYRKELALVHKAIKHFDAMLEARKEHSSKIVSRLSKSILHVVGLSDKKGKPLYKPEPVARWQKREHTLKYKLSQKVK